MRPAHTPPPTVQKERVNFLTPANMLEALHRCKLLLDREFHCGPVAQLDRASDFGSEGWGFDSLRGRQNLKAFSSAAWQRSRAVNF
jgi:hypothetical protein